MRLIEPSHNGNCSKVAIALKKNCARGLIVPIFILAAEGKLSVRYLRNLKSFLLLFSPSSVICLFFLVPLTIISTIIWDATMNRMCRLDDGGICCEQHSKVVQKLFFWDFQGPSFSLVKSSVLMKVGPAGSWNTTLWMFRFNGFKIVLKLCWCWGSSEMAEPAECEEQHAVWLAHNLKIEQCGAIHLNSC